jgi:uncharacterized protein YcfL
MRCLYIIMIVVVISGCKANDAIPLHSSEHVVVSSNLISPSTSKPMNSSTPNQPSLQPSNDDQFNKLSESDKKLLQQNSPKEIIKIYYQAIVDKNYDLAHACLMGSEAGNQNTLDRYISIKNLQIKLPDKLADGYEIPQTDTSVMFEVQYDVVIDPNKGSAEATGRSLYFVGLQRKSSADRWKISVLGTAP